jgi:hypothetical protein
LGGSLGFNGNTTTLGDDWGAALSASLAVGVSGVTATKGNSGWDAAGGFGFGAGGFFGPQFSTPAMNPFGDSYVAPPGAPTRERLHFYDPMDPDPSPREPGGRPPGSPGPRNDGNDSRALDPNEKIGPGAGEAGWLAAGALAPYRINFENLGPGSRDANGNPFTTFTAPAHRVTIADRLDTGLDWQTFELTELGFGDVLIPVENHSHFTGRAPMTNGQTFDVELQAGIDFATGRVSVVFQSVDPATSLPPDVLTGFLPPEDGTGRGKGHVSYVIRAKGNLPTGTAVRNVADIRFDINDVISTDQIDPQDPAQGIDPAKQALVTLDANPPASVVSELAAETVQDFEVNWSGSDAGSGIASYDVYVSEDGSAWTLWLSGVTSTSGFFQGTLDHTYAFRSVARDLAGNVQPLPSSAQTTTVKPALEPILRFLPGGTRTQLFLRISARAGPIVNIEPRISWIGSQWKP